MGAGLISYFIGVHQINEHAAFGAQTHNGNDQGIGEGIYPALFGILSFAAGTGLVIGGSIHEIHRAHKRKFSLIIRQANQLGLAYHF